MLEKKSMFPDPWDNSTDCRKLKDETFMPNFEGMPWGNIAKPIMVESKQDAFSDACDLIGETVIQVKFSESRRDSFDGRSGEHFSSSEVTFVTQSGKEVTLNVKSG